MLKSCVSQENFRLWSVKHQREVKTCLYWNKLVDLCYTDPGGTSGKEPICQYCRRKTHAVSFLDWEIPLG